jgi:hypothetical protein
VIADVDEVLRKLLTREIDAQGNEVDIQFDAPSRGWSSRLSKPTINLFLFDIRTNLRLRGAEQFTTIAHQDGTSEVHVNPVRVDLRYLMTAWVKEPEDQHLLLSSAMIGMLRNPFLPKDLYTDDLKSQPGPIPLDVATFPPENGPMDKFTEIWGVLDNEIQPGILVTVTISVDPYKPLIFKQVRTREIVFVQDSGPGVSAEAPQTKSTRVISKRYHVTGGTIRSDKYDPSRLTVVLVEKHLPLQLKADGRFILPNLAEGEYHLDILLNKKVLKRQKIQVPDSNYEIQI